MTAPVIAYIRATAHLSDSLVAAYVAAQQIQLDRDFAKYWQAPAACVFVPGGHTIPPGAWLCWLLDNSDQANELGYHDLTPNRLPLLKVFVSDALRDGLSWTVTASHETIEALGDPVLNKTIHVDGKEYACELCDPCQDDRFAYSINGQLMSDFVTPNWFIPGAHGPYTFRGACKAPLELAEGGFISTRMVPGGKWTQIFAEGVPGQRAIKGPSSRTVRRMTASL